MKTCQTSRAQCLSVFCIASGNKNENILKKKNQNKIFPLELVFKMQISNYISHLNTNMKVMTNWFQSFGKSFSSQVAFHILVGKSSY